MRFLSSEEVEAIFLNPRFSVSLDHLELSYSYLQLDPAHANSQQRVAAQQPSNIGGIPYFVRALNRWLPTNQTRLLWADRWELGTYSSEYAIVAAARRGLGETRTSDEAPGLYFDAQDWNEEDQYKVSPAQAEAMGILVGFTAMLMLTQSRSWLISANCADRIEFWDGNFFFHSNDQEQLKRADEIIAEFQCVCWKS